MDVRFDSLARADWDAALGPDVPLQQSWAYGATMEALGAQVLRAEVVDAGRCLFRAQLLWRRTALGSLGVLNRALLPPTGAGPALAALRRALPSGPLRALILSTESAGVRRCGLPVLTPVHVAEIDLRQPPRALRAAMSGKWRNRLVRAEAQGLHLSVSRRPPAWLLRQEACQQREKRYRGLPPEFAKAWADQAPLSCFVARKGGQVLAAMLFVHHGARASYQIGWSGADGRKRGAHPWLLWQAMQALPALGISTLELGSVATDTAPGLARFKIGAGAHVRPLGRTSLLFPGLAMACRGGEFLASSGKAKGSLPCPHRSTP